VKPLQQTLATVLLQVYPHFRVWLLSEQSIDTEISDLMESLEKMTEKFPGKLKIIRRHIELSTQAIYYGLQLVRANAAPNDLVLTLSVGDVMSSHYALQIINDQFISQACWILYGNTRRFDFRTRKEFNSSAEEDNGLWKPSVYRAFLLDGVSQDSFKEGDGNWIRDGHILAPFVFDLLELSSQRHGYQTSDTISSSQVSVDRESIEGAQSRLIKEGYDRAVIFPYSACCGKKKC